MKNNIKNNFFKAPGFLIGGGRKAYILSKKGEYNSLICVSYEEGGYNLAAFRIGGKL